MKTDHHGPGASGCFCAAHHCAENSGYAAHPLSDVCSVYLGRLENETQDGIFSSLWKLYRGAPVSKGVGTTLASPRKKKGAGSAHIAAVTKTTQLGSSTSTHSTVTAWTPPMVQGLESAEPDFPEDITNLNCASIKCLLYAHSTHTVHT